MCTQQVMNHRLQTYSNLCNVLDSVFLGLCILSPTEEEIEKIELSLMILKKIWTTKLIINISPKAVLFAHAIPQLITLNRIANKCEDFIELAHHTGNCLDYLMTRVPNTY